MFETVKNLRTIVGLLVIVLAGREVTADTPVIPREHHVWARFVPGAWSTVRKVSQEFDQRGEVASVSTTETKTTLVAVDDDGCQLRQEVTVTLGAKRFTSQPKLTRIGLLGETDGVQATVRKLHTTELDAGGVLVMCDIIEAKLATDDKQIISTLWYSDGVPPFVLRRDSKVTNKDGNLVHEEASVQVVALEMPCQVGSEIKSGAYLRTTTDCARGSSISVEVICADVPGGVISRSQTELDNDGNLLRQSTLQVIDYGVEADPPVLYRRPLLFHHKRSRRGTAP
jgi:hypothetical protein